MEHERWQEANDRHWRQDNEGQYRHRLENQRHDGIMIRIEVDVVALFQL